MLFTKKSVRLVAPLLALALGAAACGGGDDSGSGSPSEPAAGKKGGTFRLGIAEPTAIDPYNAQESEGILVTKQIFTQLVGLDEDAKIVPAAAKSFTPNDDCTQWTFELVPDAKFSNGEVVTAQSFIDGWTRAATQDAASDVAYHMAGVQGFDELQRRLGHHVLRAVRAGPEHPRRGPGRGRLRVREEDPAAGDEPRPQGRRAGQQQDVQRHADRQRPVQARGPVAARHLDHDGPQRRLLRQGGQPRPGRGHHLQR